MFGVSGFNANWALAGPAHKAVAATAAAMIPFAEARGLRRIALVTSPAEPSRPVEDAQLQAANSNSIGNLRF
ncbi:hypothetical protein D3C80_1557960 [compost metagenome]